MTYDRAHLIAILVAHQRHTASGCLCGWSELGHSHAEHVALAYEASLLRGDPLRLPLDDEALIARRRRRPTPAGEVT